jgi:hypothetical protein
VPSTPELARLLPAARVAVLAAEVASDAVFAGSRCARAFLRLYLVPFLLPRPVPLAPELALGSATAIVAVLATAVNAGRNPVRAPLLQANTVLIVATQRRLPPKVATATFQGSVTRRLTLLSFRRPGM